MSEKSIYFKNLNIITLLFISFFNITNGFKILGNYLTEIITLLMLILVAINSRNLFLEKIRIFNPILVYLFSSLITMIILLFLGIYYYDKHALQVAYFFLMILIFIYLMLINLSDNSRYENFLKYYSYFIFILSILNILTFIQIVFMHFLPIFSINLGTVQPRTYEHFITGAMGESSRFISYFGEPSDFLWVSASGLFILLRYNYFFLSYIVFFSILITGSGSIIPAIFLLFLYLGLYKKNKFFNYLLFLLMSLVFIIFFSELTLIKSIQRWYTPDGTFTFLSKINHIMKGTYQPADSNHHADLGPLNPLYTFFPHKISNMEGLNYLNNFFYVIGRLGILSAPFVLSSIALIVLTLKKFILTSNFELVFSILCFLLLLVSRASFHFLPIFWFLFLCAREIVPKNEN